MLVEMVDIMKLIYILINIKPDIIFCIFARSRAFDIDSSVQNSMAYGCVGLLDFDSCKMNSYCSGKMQVPKRSSIMPNDDRSAPV